MDDGTRHQLEVIRTFTTLMTRAGHRAWLFGGWGLDARIGRVTRDHGDIEFWVDHRTAPLVQPLVVGAGAVADGTFASRHRFDDWVFPRGSFPDEPVELAGLPVLAMSAAGMLAMKEQFPRLRNGRPWRDKDVADMELLRSLLGIR